MDKGSIFPIISFLLTIYLLANLISYSEIINKWQIDPTKNIINTGNASISKIISPPKTKILAIDRKKAIHPIHITKEQIDELMLEPDFKADLDSNESLLLYRKRNISLVLVSDYFNENEIDTLSNDGHIIYLLYNTSWMGTVNISYVDVKDPTNAMLETIFIDNESSSLIISYNMRKENLLKIENSSLFIDAVKESKKTARKNLFIYQDSESGSRVIIPTGFSDEEIERLLKSSAVKTALAAMSIKAGEAVSLDSTPEFKDINIANLPYNPDTRIYITFNLPSLVASIPTDWFIYSSALIAALIILYLIYRLFL